MSNKTVTRMDLYNAAHASCTSLTRNEAKEIVEIAIEEICAVLALGEAVKLSGFGAFSVRPKTARVGRNPRNGKSYPIDARYVLKFRSSRSLSAAVTQALRSQAKPAVPPQRGVRSLENSTTHS